MLASFVKFQRGSSNSRVFNANRVEQERCCTNGRICIARAVEVQRSSAHRSVKAAGSFPKPPKSTNCFIRNVSSESLKSAVPLRSREVGISSIGWWDNGLHLRQERDGRDHHQSERLINAAANCFHVFFISFV